MKILIATDTYFPSLGGLSFTIKHLFEYLQFRKENVKLIAPGPKCQGDQHMIRLPFFKDPFVKGKTGPDFCKTSIIKSSRL